MQGDHETSLTSKPDDQTGLGGETAKTAKTFHQLV